MRTLPGAAGRSAAAPCRAPPASPTRCRPLALRADKVKHGDSLWSISQKLHIDFHKVLDLNKQLDHPDVVHTGACRGPGQGGQQGTLRARGAAVEGRVRGCRRGACEGL